MCSVLNTLKRVSTQGAKNVCSSALCIEHDRRSRKFHLEKHRAPWSAHPFLCTVLLQSHQGACFRCGPFSREHGEGRRPCIRRQQSGRHSRVKAKGLEIESLGAPHRRSLQVRKVGSERRRRAWGVPLLSSLGGAGLLCFGSIQFNTKTSSV